MAQKETLTTYNRMALLIERSIPANFSVKRAGIKKNVYL